MLSQYNHLIILLLFALFASRLVLSARIEDLIESASEASPSAESSSSGGSLVWQPLRATFRPLNRPSTSGPPPPPQPPFISFPTSAELAAAASTTTTTDLSSSEGTFSELRTFPGAAASSASPFQPTLAPTTTPVVAAAAAVSVSLGSTTPAPAFRSLEDDEEQPTRVPLNRFRPTKPPSVDPQSQPSPGNSFLLANSGSQNPSSSNSTLFASSSSLNIENNSQSRGPYRITNECYECICEASTNCNPNSRCQTSDVRHTRCGMLLISYDQWLETGLSRQLVSREALARDAAADERAFYECVTDRECAERLMAIYMQKNARDCDKDGRIDCYDVAAIHQGGKDQCNSESLLDSQYWSDFNACFGFGR